MPVSQRVRKLLQAAKILVARRRAAKLAQPSTSQCDKPSANNPVAKYPPGSTEPYPCLTIRLIAESLQHSEVEAAESGSTNPPKRPRF